MSREYYQSIQDTATDVLIKLAINFNAQLDLMSEDSEEQFEKKDIVGNQYWDIVHTIAKRGTENDLEQVKKLVTSDDSNARVLSADILGRFNWQEKQTYYEYQLTTLIHLLDDENIDVIGSSACAISHLTLGTDDFRAVEKLVSLSTHSYPFIREGVVAGLSGLEDMRAINTLIKLMDDDEDYIRDWATFGIGSQIETDTPEIRQALLAKLNHADVDERGEAMVGLAERLSKNNDDSQLEQVINAIRKDLTEADTCYSVNASRILAHPSLLPDLLAVKALDNDYSDYFKDSLADAITACSP